MLDFGSGVAFAVSASYESGLAESRVRISVKALSTLNAKSTLVNIFLEEVGVPPKLTKPNSLQRILIS